MEAMKMEHTIAAPADGTVAELLYAPGDQVAEGAELLKLARLSAPARCRMAGGMPTAGRAARIQA
jgi:pyruvate/2-oxoglutarate dehydrogenase complex dihydrolipoamide acyltransferase (E2) component